MSAMGDQQRSTGEVVSRPQDEETVGQSYFSDLDDTSRLWLAAVITLRLLVSVSDGGFIRPNPNWSVLE